MAAAAARLRVVLRPEAVLVGLLLLLLLLAATAASASAGGVEGVCSEVRD